ncbi:MAG TPA: hypothetical protein VJV79_21825, partial [Polyangiaceae bacterium]|nr:hypothetical protein [Polyangiaceae bacterium]
GGGGKGGTGGGGKGGTEGGGKGGTGGGAAGGAGAPTLGCPATPPVVGSACASNHEACFFEDCSGVGRTAATCEGGTWTVRTTACGAVQCLSGTCSSGQICAVTQGGAQIATCVESTCGTGPLTCACAGASCSICSIGGTIEQGITVTCNTCPQGGCP